MDDFDFKFKNAKVSALKQLYGDLKPEFQDGGSVTTPKRGLVDEPGSYAGKKEADRAKEYRRRKNMIGEDRSPEYISKEAERTRRYRERNPYQLKTTNVTVNGKKYIIPNNAMKPDSAKGLIKFLDALSKDPSPQNVVKLLKNKPKNVADAIRNYGYYLREEKMGAYATGKGDTLTKFFDNLKPELPKEATDFLSQEGVTKQIKGATVREYATPASADKFKRESFEKVIKINNEFKKNPKITLEQLTQKIYANEFSKADDAKKLKLATQVSDDVAKYLEALKDARKVPRGMSSRWNPPTGKKFNEISKYITSQSQGFRFRDATLRNYKYRIRDSLLGFEPNYTKNLELRIKNIRGVLDHAVGLSATHEVAPGYSGLYQDLEASLNQTKGIKIDKPFTKVLRQVVRDGDFSGVDNYNKLASDFKKINKGIDVPFIKKGGDPKKLITSFDNLDEASQKNILKLSKGEAGFAIETKAKAISQLLGDLGCGKAGGGRIKFAEGSNCVRKGLDIMENADVKNTVQAKKIMNIAKEAGNPKQLKSILNLLVAGSGAAIVAEEVIAETLFAANGLLKGKPLKEAWADSYLSYIPGLLTGKGLDKKSSKDLAVESFKSPNLTATNEIQNIDEQLNSLEENRQTELNEVGFEIEGTTSDITENQINQKYDQRKKELINKRTVLKNKLTGGLEANINLLENKLRNKKDSEEAKSIMSEMGLRDQLLGIPGIPDDMETQSEAGVIRPVARYKNNKTIPKLDIPNYLNETYLKPFKKKYPDLTIKDLREYEDEQGNRVFNNAMISDLMAKDPYSQGTQSEDAGFFGETITPKPMYDFAGGGIAKLAGKRSGPAPQSGPTPQGLDYLLKRGRQY